MKTPCDEITAAKLFGITREPANTREKLLFTAINLFYEFGFHAVGLDRIIKEVGVTKTTFYNHFESKDDLILAALEERHKWESTAWMETIGDRAGDDPKAQLLAVFEVLDIWFNHPRFKGCLFINAASEFPLPTDPVHQKAGEHFVATQGAFRDMAERAGLKDPQLFAERMGLLVHGAITLRLSAGHDAAAEDARAMTEMLMDEHVT